VTLIQTRSLRSIGGNRRLHVGDYLLPPTETGVLGMSDLNPLCRRDRVYLTRSIDGARFFASAAPNPVVYEAVPEGEIEADPDCTEPGVSIACQKAKIIPIHKIPGKVIKKNQKRMRAAAATPQKNSVNREIHRGPPLRRSQPLRWNAISKADTAMSRWVIAAGLKLIVVPVDSTWMRRSLASGSRARASHASRARAGRSRQRQSKWAGSTPERRW
jgi:hypothetical protein